MVGVILAGFGILIGLFAVVWFGTIKNEAKAEAREEIREHGRKIIGEWLDRNPDFK